MKLYIKKYLISGSGQEVDKRLRALNIEDGFNGLDFKESGFLENGNDDIDIVVKYKIRLPVPVKILPELELVQRAAARAWMGGDEAASVLDAGAGEDIWALDNFTRGKKIRSLFGANLPSNFPVIAKFENGKAVMIKSMDLTAESYLSGDSLEKTLDGYLKELFEYKGQESPWGKRQNRNQGG